MTESIECASLLTLERHTLTIFKNHNQTNILPSRLSSTSKSHISHLPIPHLTLTLPPNYLTPSKTPYLHVSSPQLPYQTLLSNPSPHTPPHIFIKPLTTHHASYLGTSHTASPPPSTHHTAQRGKQVYTSTASVATTTTPHTAPHPSPPP
jgi:hypothetical protein